MNHLIKQQPMSTSVTNKVVSITITSLEIMDQLNETRTDGKSILRHDSFMDKVPKVLGSLAPTFIGTSFYINGAESLFFLVLCKSL